MKKNPTTESKQNPEDQPQTVRVSRMTFTVELVGEPADFAAAIANIMGGKNK